MTRSPAHLELGKRAEDGAAALLRREGLQILQRNFRCRMGEIDIIALSPSHLVFIEVRHRRSSRFGSAAESVSIRKQQRIITTARFFLSRGQYGNYPCRFDIIESSLDHNGELVLNWLQNAFQ